MLVSLLWLEELLGMKLEIDRIKKDALSLGFEVEETTRLAPDHVVVGKIIAVKPHPRRTDLYVLRIRTNKELCIVSADTTIAVDDRVLVCPAGAVFKDQTIAPRDFDGVTSQGMLISEQELGLIDRSIGVIVLDKGKPGDSFAACFDDVVLDMSATPNRPDWLSVDGIARELAIRLAIDYNTHSVINRLPDVIPANKRGTFSLTLQDHRGCPRYTARLFQDIIVKESPFWIKWRLHCMGMNAVNNVVDITNIIMLLTGQPLHPFDHDLLKNGIIVRKARPNEIFVTLEGTELKLDPDDCVIADAGGPIALGGIIGSPRAQISKHTNRVVLESAYFDPKTIAHTSHRLGVTTEASMRFERGGDLYAVDGVSDLTGDWFEQYTSAKESYYVSAGKKGKPVTISFTPNRLNEVLALSLKKTEIKTILKKADVKITGTDIYTAHIPHFRRDLCIEEDIYEEVARIYGYMNIPEIRPGRWGGRVKPDADRKQEMAIRNRLVGQGFSETYNLSLIASSQAVQFGFGDFVTLKNPLNERFDALRPTLFIGLIDSVNYNLSQGNKSLKLFEIGNILLNQEPFQECRIGIVLGGKRYPDHWERCDERLDYYDVKGVVETLCCVLHVKDISFKAAPRTGFTQSTTILMAGKELGYLGSIDPLYCKEPYYYAELSLDRLLAMRSESCYIAPARFPANTRDLSFLVEKDVTVPRLMASIQKMGGPVLEKVTLFDYYKGKNLPERCKNLGFRLYFRAPDRTLNDKEVDTFVDKIELEITKRFNAKLRKKE
ncbi:phenylalanine--tRNA ligase subunit beta [candidate division WOR-3 bacterium]|nr:phenylalanine--tRNA ligase subunit beta [candidate division WOR-3 bacterium]